MALLINNLNKMGPRPLRLWTVYTQNALMTRLFRGEDDQMLWTISDYRIFVLTKWCWVVKHKISFDCNRAIWTVNTAARGTMIWCDDCCQTLQTICVSWTYLCAKSLQRWGQQMMVQSRETQQTINQYTQYIHNQCTIYNWIKISIKFKFSFWIWIGVANKM